MAASKTSNTVYLDMCQISCCNRDLKIETQSLSKRGYMNMYSHSALSQGEKMGRINPGGSSIRDDMVTMLQETMILQHAGILARTNESFWANKECCSLSTRPHSASSEYKRLTTGHSAT